MQTKPFCFSSFIGLLAMAAVSHAADCTQNGWCKLKSLPTRSEFGHYQNIFAESQDDVVLFERLTASKFDGKSWQTADINPSRPTYSGYLATKLKNKFVSVANYSAEYLMKFSFTSDVEKGFGGSSLELGGNIYPGDTIWGTDTNNIYTSVHGRVQHYDGKQWKDVPVAGDIIVGSGPENVWISRLSAGRVGNSLIVHRLEKGTWKETKIPYSEQNATHITAMWTDRPEHGFVATSGSYEVLIYGIEGDKITRFDLETTQDIRKFAGFSRDNLYAAGGMTHYYQKSIFETLVAPAYGYITHFNGKEWKEEESGISGGQPSESIADISMSPVDGSVWAVSSREIIFKKGP